MPNAFIRFIDEGKIRDRADLRSVYMKIVMKTHPDTLGSDKLVHKFIRLTDQYEEAKRYLAQRLASIAADSDPIEENIRLSFFKHLHDLEALDFPFNRNKSTYIRDLANLNDLARICFLKWRAGDLDLYSEAQKELDTLRSEMPMGPYRKHALYLNLRPVFHNIASYHLTGVRFYEIQVKRNLDAVIERLDERNFTNLKKYMLLLIEDMENGPALFGK
jgi:hypothetical protein